MFERIVYRHPFAVVMLSEGKDAARRCSSGSSLAIRAPSLCYLRGRTRGGGVAPIVDLLPKGKDAARRCFARIVYRHPSAVVKLFEGKDAARRCSSESTIVIRPPSNVRHHEPTTNH